ncbi:MAG TPA: NAD(P)/FAD-dependent oxidoreductase [Vicinamibacterales bacterium]|jgi:flavin-dependent dehydrogenase
MRTPDGVHHAERGVDHCEVLIVGGGPAGSSCAWKLRAAGVDVAVIDRAVFPRDKVCAGWITPQVVDELQLDTRSYSAGRTFQPITGFRVGVIGSDRTLDTAYRRPVSFGIRRCEFDDFLLRRSGARLLLGEGASRIRRSGAKWVVNDRVEASVLVGAAGHCCPVAGMLNGPADRTPLVAAQEAEFPVEAAEANRYAIDGEKPELYFTRAFDGYGWCFRKGDYLNVGFGRLNARALPADSAGFVRFLQARHAVPGDLSLRWRGHAYLVSSTARPRLVDDGVLLAGDAAGLAYPQSGEGIRPAIESGLLAAAAIVRAGGRYSRDRLGSYARQLRQRFGSGGSLDWLSRALPPGLPQAVGPQVLRSRWMVRHIVLDRWFLHAADRPIQ